MTSSSGPCLQLGNRFESLAAGVERLVVAFSGGMDSCVLLHLLISHSPNFKIRLLHVNHGIQDSAGEMEEFCSSIAEHYHLPIGVSRLNLDANMPNMEAEARHARYALFEQELTPGDCLLTAHHADDQAETLLLNILRGSGSAGLRGIAYNRPIGESMLIRPLLDFSRAEINAYAEHHRLEWYDDPSNLSQRFNRNYLRHEVLPKIKSRWPGYLDSVRSVVAIQSETQLILNEFGKADFQISRLQNEMESCDLLNCNALRELSQPRQKNLIRYWLNKYHFASLPQSRLNELIRQLNVATDSMPVVNGQGYEIRSYRHNLYIVPPDNRLAGQETYHFERSKSLVVQELDLELKRKLIFKHLGQNDEGQSITLKFRLDDKASNPDIHRLKRLFQKHKIPPWKRSLTPQIYLNDMLVGLWF